MRGKIPNINYFSQSRRKNGSLFCKFNKLNVNALRYTKFMRQDIFIIKDALFNIPGYFFFLI